MSANASANQKMQQVINLKGRQCRLIKEAFDIEYCEKLLRQAKTHGFSKALDKYPSTYRNNDRLQVDNVGLAKELFEVCKSYIPDSIEKGQETLTLDRLNPRLRYCRYRNQQKFTVHKDGVYYEREGTKSHLTFLLYLNDGAEFSGGETVFYADRKGHNELVRVKPQRGGLLIFDHDLWHCGDEVLSGEKYILRTDVLYRYKAHSQMQLAHHEGYIWKIAAISGERLVSIGRDKCIKIWNKEMQPLQTLRLHHNSVFDVLEDDCSRLVAVSRDGYLTRWETGTNGFQVESCIDTGHPSVLGLVELQNKTLLTYGPDGILRVWNQNLDLQFQMKLSDEWITDTKNLDVQEPVVGCSTNLGEFVIVDLLKQKVLSKVSLGLGPIRTFKVAKNIVYLGLESGVLSVFDMKNLFVLENIDVHEGAITDIELAGDKILTSSEDGEIKATQLDGNSMTLHKEDDFITSLCTRNECLYFAGYSGRITSQLLSLNDF